jgi:DNA-binding MarR family transcriptional regulator
MTRPIKSASAKKAAAAKDLTARARAVVGECHARAARSVARKIIATYDREFAPHDLNLPQFVLLAMIASATDDTLAAIADAADIDPSTLTRNLQGLERQGLVEIATVETDQRKRSVWLTETGARRLEAALPAWERAQAEVKSKVGPGLFAALLRAEAAL